MVEAVVIVCGLSLPIQSRPSSAHGSCRDLTGMGWPGARTAARARSLATASDVLPVLEVLASERPEVVGAVVETLASSPARPALLELARLFQVEAPEELAGAVVTVVRQLDRLEHQPRRWTEPREVLGSTAASATALDAVARWRADRWRSTRGGTRPARLRRVDRRLKDAAGLERARALVDGLLGDSRRSSRAKRQKC